MHNTYNIIYYNTENWDITVIYIVYTYIWRIMMHMIPAIYT